MALGITAAATPARAAPPWMFIQVAVGSPQSLCLQAGPGSQFQLQVYAQPCDFSDRSQNQWWQLINWNGNGYKLENFQTGECLYADTVFNGTPIALWDCRANISNERWAWNADSHGFATLESRISGTTGHCMAPPAAQITAGTAMQLSTCDDSVAQGVLEYSTP
jgi:hypothetical protein